MASSVKTKSAQNTFITLCANCSYLKITETHWVGVSKAFEAQFRVRTQISHGICPKCMEILYGDLFSDDFALGE